MKKKKLVIIPAFNEENNITAVVNDVKRNCPDWDILVINDCSTDSTSHIAHNLSDIFVVDLPCNLGIGGAVQTGFKFSKIHNYDYAVQIDGDGQHLPAEVAKLFHKMSISSCDMIIGSRFLDITSFRTTWLRRLGIKTFYWLFYFLIGLKITDSTSGFRLYNKKSIDVLAKFYPDDYPEPDAIILLNKNNLTLCEVGVAMREREHGQSSISLIQGPYYMIKVILSILFSYSRTRW